MREFPELVVNRYVVNTSFDSGLLVPSDAERKQGWYVHGELAHSPLIRSTDQLPYDQFDEWLVFEKPVQIDGFKTMVNHVGFTPIDFDWEDKRERYWDQVLRLQPLHIIAQNNVVYLISRDTALVARLIQLAE